MPLFRVAAASVTTLKTEPGSKGVPGGQDFAAHIPSRPWSSAHSGRKSGNFERQYLAGARVHGNQAGMIGVVLFHRFRQRFLADELQFPDRW